MRQASAIALGDDERAYLEQFVEKVRDIVGLYIDPPEKAIVVCVDEKSQIQALDRTQPMLPMRPGRSSACSRCWQTSRSNAVPTPR